MPFSDALQLLRGPSRDKVEQQFRDQARYWYLGGNTAMCHVLGNQLMYVDTTDYALAPHLIRDGFWEIWITQAMARILQPGMIAVDVGANVGYYTLLMANVVGAEGRVVALEPNPRLAELLRQTLSVNGFDSKVTLDTRAASLESGHSIQFIIPKGRPMNAAIGDSASEGDQIIRTQTIRLDQALPEKVDFIKIDVEGAEQLAWQGLQKTLDANPRIKIFLEFNSNRYPETAASFIQQIVDQGFKLAYVDTNSALVSCTAAYVLSQGSHDVILYLER